MPVNALEYLLFLGLRTFGLSKVHVDVKKMVKCSRYRAGVAQRVGRVIALLFHDHGMPRPHFTPGKDPVPMLQEAAWAPGPVWTGGKSRPPPGFDP